MGTRRGWALGVRILRAALCLLAALSLPACARRPPEGRAGAAAPVAMGEPPGEGAALQGAALQGPALPSPAAGPSAPQPGQPQPSSGDHHLVLQPLPAALGPARLFGPAAPLAAIAPSDFAIGALADSRPASREEAEAVGAALAYLDGFVKGRYREDLVLEGRKPFLALLSAPLIEEPRPSSFRLGRLRLATDPGSGESVAGARLRLGGRVGEIDLRLSGGGWRVEGLSLGQAEEAGPYEPSLEGE